MFIDEIKVHARAGHGGKGCVAFLRETSRPKGGPIGGNGGWGGDVILEAAHDLSDLTAQFFQSRLVADKGGNGLGKGMDGRAGEDLIVKVPCGTLVWKLDTGAASESDDSDDEYQNKPYQPTRADINAQKDRVIRGAGSSQAVEINLENDSDFEYASMPGAAAPVGELIADMVEDGQKFVLCKGGQGGQGNRNFATARRQTPRFAQPGEPGEEGDFRLELRVVADVGLVGYPNAGKSTLLTAISSAHPKVASYPFTTLHPQVGVAVFPDYHRMTVCDVPGLIEGAHRNVGLGHNFLRHIKRCKVLVIMLDMAGTDNRAPWDDYRQLMNELALYDASLLERPRMVVANKMDEPSAAENLRKFKRRVTKTPVLPISAGFDQGLEEFKLGARKIVEQQKALSQK